MLILLRLIKTRALLSLAGNTQTETLDIYLIITALTESAVLPVTLPVLWRYNVMMSWWFREHITKYASPPDPDYSTC